MPSIIAQLTGRWISKSNDDLKGNEGELETIVINTNVDETNVKTAVRSERRSKMASVLQIAALVSLFVVLLLLLFTVVKLYMKTTDLEAKLIDEEEAFVEEAIHSHSNNKPIGKVNEGEPLAPPSIGTNDVIGKGLRLIGQKTHESFVQSDDESSENRISTWTLEEVGNGQAVANFFNVSSDGITVKRNGLYTVYSQISWRMKRGVARFNIVRDQDRMSLTQCVSHFGQSYAQIKSCYTSVTTKLRKGDTLYISVVDENLSVDFIDGRSFFGIVLLQEYPSNVNVLQARK